FFINNNLRLNNAIGILKSHFVFSSEKEFCYMHPLIQAVIRDQLDEKDLSSSILERIVSVLEMLIVNERDEFIKRENSIKIFGHIQNLLNYCNKGDMLQRINFMLEHCIASDVKPAERPLEKLIP